MVEAFPTPPRFTVTPGVRFLPVAVVTASITVLGLLLTLLGLSHNSDYRFNPRFYKRVGHGISVR